MSVQVPMNPVIFFPQNSFTSAVQNAARELFNFGNRSCYIVDQYDLKDHTATIKRIESKDRPCILSTIVKVGLIFTGIVPLIAMFIIWNAPQFSYSIEVEKPKEPLPPPKPPKEIDATKQEGAQVLDLAVEFGKLYRGRATSSTLVEGIRTLFRIDETYIRSLKTTGVPNGYDRDCGILFDELEEKFEITLLFLALYLIHRNSDEVVDLQAFCTWSMQYGKISLAWDMRSITFDNLAKGFALRKLLDILNNAQLVGKIEKVANTYNLSCGIGTRKDEVLDGLKKLFTNVQEIVEAGRLRDLQIRRWNSDHVTAVFNAFAVQILHKDLTHVLGTMGISGLDFTDRADRNVISAEHMPLINVAATLFLCYLDKRSSDPELGERLSAYFHSIRFSVNNFCEYFNTMNDQVQFNKEEMFVVVKHVLKKFQEKGLVDTYSCDRSNCQVTVKLNSRDAVVNTINNVARAISPQSVGQQFLGLFGVGDAFMSVTFTNALTAPPAASVPALPSTGPLVEEVE